MTQEGEDFYCLAADCSAEVKIRRSTFICSLGYTESMEEAKAFIADVSGSHRNAAHNCWAYIVGDRGETVHCSDAGEPAGTAGQPILNTLAGYNLTCVSAVVTRYFGGVKLGIRGLIDAYGDSVKNAVEAGRLVKFVRTRLYTVKVGYEFNDMLIHHLKDINCRIAWSDYTDIVTHAVKVEENDTDAADALFREFEKTGRIEQVDSEDENGMKKL
ncbi:MAG: IMPACT family protein [Thermodesulfobacteriota bacterium]